MGKLNKKGDGNTECSQHTTPADLDKALFTKPYMALTSSKTLGPPMAWYLRAQTTGAEHIDLVAHSTGNRILGDAIVRAVTELKRDLFLVRC